MQSESSKRHALGFKEAGLALCIFSWTGWYPIYIDTEKVAAEQFTRLMPVLMESSFYSWGRTESLSPELLMGNPFQGYIETVLVI